MKHHIRLFISAFLVLCFHISFSQNINDLPPKWGPVHNGYEIAYDSIKQHGFSAASPVEWIVTRFGADSTGVSDSRAAVLAALAAMGPRGGILRFPAGIYSISDSINIGANVKVVGCGKTLQPPLSSEIDASNDSTGTLIVFNSTSKNLFVFNPISGKVVVNGFSIRDITIINTATSPTGGSAIKIKNGQQFIIDNCGFSGWYNTIFINGRNDWTVSNCAFYGQVHTDLYITNTNPEAGSFHISHNLFNSLQHEQTYALIYWRGSGGIMIDNNNFLGKTHYACYFDDSLGVTGFDLKMVNNLIENYDSTGIYVKCQPSPGAFNMQLTNTEMQSFEGSTIGPALYISHVSQITINNLIVHQTLSTDQPAISLVSCVGVRIDGGYAVADRPIDMDVTCGDVNIAPQWNDNFSADPNTGNLSLHSGNTNHVLNVGGRIYQRSDSLDVNNTNSVALVYNPTTQTYAKDMYPPVKAVYATSTGKTISNTTTETTIIPSGIGSLTVAAGNFNQIGATYKINTGGVFSTAATPGNLTIRVKLGSVVLDSVILTDLTPSASFKGWHLSFTVTLRHTGSTGDCNFDGQLFSYNSTGLDVQDMNSSLNKTVNTTISNAFDVTATWATADTNNSFTTRVFTIERLF